MLKKILGYQDVEEITLVNLSPILVSKTSSIKFFGVLSQKLKSSMKRHAQPQLTKI
jgi:hypothetical protein